MVKNNIKLSESVVDKFVQGDMESFMLVYEATKDMIFTVIMRMVSHAHDAEDIMHDVYIKVYDQREKYQKDKAALSTWFYRIAINETLNHQKRSKRVVLDLPDISIQYDFLGAIIEKDRYHAFQAVLNQIPDIYRVCLVLSEIEGVPYDAIAEILAIPVGTVASRINRAKTQLKALCERGGLLCTKPLKIG